MIRPYLMFNRQCEEAFEFYKMAFAGDYLEFKTYADLPAEIDFDLSEEEKSLVLRAELQLTPTGRIMGSDILLPFQHGENMAINTAFDSEQTLRSVWNGLIKEGNVIMDLTPTFFTKLFGEVIDRYGIKWLFLLESEE